jgi:acyl carrier protein
MSEQDIIERFELIFREVFDDESLVISTGTTAADIEDWDSLAHINLLVAIEENFSVSFSLEELQTVKNVGEMVTLVARKVG